MNKKYHFGNSYLSNPVRAKEHTYVYQAGLLYLEGDGYVDTHIQPNLIELTSVVGGNGYVYTNGVATPVKRGDIYISFPQDLHKITSVSDPALQYEYISFNTTNPTLKEALDELTVRFANPENRVFTDDQLTALISVAVAEVSGRGKYFEEYIDSLINQIIVKIIRGLDKWNPLSLAPNNEQQLCYYVMNYIDTHVFTLKNISSLAKVTNYNYSYLSNLFKKTTGISINDYYKTKRMEKAKHLVECKLKLTEIAETFNYSSVYAFSKAYKAHFGHSPIADRKAIKNK
ncbi:MAG: helix-turn-helix transcriptional regulator [Clostridia bacterium]|nr:helix-turn-helix transcriptional regulator [Clostridia bacterium]